VTPIVLPGYDDPKHYRRRFAKTIPAAEQSALLDRLDERIDGLLRKSLVHAGLSEDLVRTAALEWNPNGFLPGVARADRYGVPDHLRRFPRLHVHLTWRTSDGTNLPLQGPFCFGAGRFYGLGLLVSLD
jgi:CRISPR-associated protein Csb2